ncbi:FYVE, RhoGEF and PH domain-containing protein, putative [Entamoeba dispar SAW760]|uniref:FYVE, RhoGEF and PH domain-containing protein, putative n=1 Tax=Entamoeba dispar (strain ATCC PRA-260 / SAW760) TaxID=370354 RepID=B0E9I9_ENTDS|nr:FYVE, RhoGEF and PH domain-containing protein, putative [Entamoeba dispar SAW760]EDR28796.1 FYVE, RhoGEF and PH domain-containing protein, putative [Entamoeba dispar SAW760]|eukprot:EDR28796.1 FYVE, RhoGEF and PH domain-containing protein, putative [Entamoeba dispar SAW760]
MEVPELPPKPIQLIKLEQSKNNLKEIKEIFKENSISNYKVEDSIDNCCSLEKRKMVCKEIYETEISYITSLGICENFYYRKMIKETSPFHAEDVKQIFLYYDEILRCNREFASMVIKSWKDKTFEDSIGELFLNFSPFFIVYRNFLINHNKAFTLLTKLEEDTKLKRYLENCQYQISTNQNLDLRDYLIMPVQRLPRYNLLLTDLLKNTPTNHCDYQNIIKALEVMKEVTTKVNESISTNKQQQKLFDLRSKLAKRNGFEVIEPHRILLSEETIIQFTHNGRSRRGLILFNDCILLTKKEEKLMKIRFIIELSRCSIVEPNKEKSLQIYSNVKSCEIEFESYEQKEHWKSISKDAIIRMKKTSDFVFSPLVISPEDVHECKICQSEIKKRKKYYCKKCLNYICSKCWNSIGKCCLKCHSLEKEKVSQKKIEPFKTEKECDFFNLNNNSNQLSIQIQSSSLTPTKGLPELKKELKKVVGFVGVLKEHQPKENSALTENTSKGCRKEQSLQKGITPTERTFQTEKDTRPVIRQIGLGKDTITLNENGYCFSPDTTKKEKVKLIEEQQDDRLIEGMDDKIEVVLGLRKKSNSMIQEEINLHERFCKKKRRNFISKSLETNEQKQNSFQKKSKKKDIVPQNSEEDSLSIETIPEGPGRVQFLKKLNEKRIQQAKEEIKRYEIKPKLVNDKK